MPHSIRRRLAVSYLAIIAVFTCSFLAAFWVVGNVTRQTRLLVDDYWQSDNLINDTRLYLKGLHPRLDSPPERDGSAFLTANRNKITTFSRRFEGSDLDSAAIAHIRMQLNRLQQDLAGLLRRATDTNAAVVATDADLNALARRAAQAGLSRAQRSLLRVFPVYYRDILQANRASDRAGFDTVVQAFAGFPGAERVQPELDRFRAQMKALFMTRDQLVRERRALQENLVALDHYLEQRSGAFSRNVVLPREAEIKNLLHRGIQALAVAGVVGSALAAWVGFALTRRLSTSLGRIGATVRAIGEGTLGARTGLAATDEPGRLGFSIDSMADRLEETVTELEREIAERQAVTASLRLSEERFRLLFRTSPDAIVLYCLDDEQLVDVNQGFETLTGFSREDVLGQPMEGLQLWKNLEDRRRFLEMLRADGMVRNFQAQFRLKNGSLRFGLISAQPLVLEDRQCILSLIRDVEEWVRVQVELKEVARERGELEHIVNHSPAVAYRARPETGWPVEYISASIVQFGYEPADFLNGEMNIEQLVHPDDWERVVDGIGGLLARPESEPLIQEYRIRGADGRLIWIDDHTWTQRDAAGQVTHCEGMMLDITEKVQLREETLQAARLASLGELAAGVAHEINNPNGLITMNATVLADAWDATLPLLDETYASQGDFLLGRLPYSRMREEIPRLQRELLDGATRVSRIVEELRDFVRIDQDVFQERFDLNRSAETALRLADNILRKATANLKVSLETGLPTVKGNRQRLEQVILNLLINASQALPSRDRGIAVVSFLERSSGQVVLEVRDQGVGIAAADLPRLTDPFFTTRRESGGTGLGLSVSARIVREHGGNLQFDSELGSGTTVRLSLPIARTEVET